MVQNGLSMMKTQIVLAPGLISAAVTRLKCDACTFCFWSLMSATKRIGIWLDHMDCTISLHMDAQAAGLVSGRVLDMSVCLT